MLDLQNQFVRAHNNTKTEDCNKIAKDNNLDLSFDSNEMMRILHRMWKLSLVTFSETEDI